MRYWHAFFAAILLAILGAGQPATAIEVTKTFSWSYPNITACDGSSLPVTFDLIANGVQKTGIVGNSTVLTVPIQTDGVINAQIRAVGPPDYKLCATCGDCSSAPALPPSEGATARIVISQTIPSDPTGLYVTKTHSTGPPIMTAPTFVAEYPTAFNSSTSPKTAMSAVAVSAGDVLVGVASRETGASGPTLNFTENGAGAWTVQDRYGLDTTTVETLSATYAASAETLTVTATAPGDLYFGGNVVRFSGSDGVGAHAQANGSGSPSVNITTTQANSAIVVIVGDWNAVSGTQTFTSAGGAGSATALTGYPGDNAHYGVAIAYYPDAGAAGSKTVGMSAPTGQQYSILAVEVKGTAGGGSASITGAGAIASVQAFGSAILSPSVLPTGVASAQAFGSAILSPSVLPTGVASAQAFGSPSLEWNALLMGVGGISSTEAIGAPSLLATVAPSGVASAQAFGGAGVSPSVVAAGIGTGEAVGQPSLTWGTLAQNLVDVGGISSTEAVGTPSLLATVAPSGVASAQAFGGAGVSLSVVAAGIGTSEAVGVPGYVGPPLGAHEIDGVGGIVSEGAVGRPTLTYVSKTGGDDLPWRKSPHKGYDRQKARQKVIDDHRQTKELEQIYSAITGTAAVPAKVKKEAAAIVVPYVKDGVRKGVVSAQSIDWNGFAQNLQRASELVTLYQQNIEDEEMAMMLLLLTAA